MTDGAYVLVHNCVYVVEFDDTRVELLQTKKFVLGRSELSDFVISSNDVSAKQCEIIYSEGNWMLRNFSEVGTLLSGQNVLRRDVYMRPDETMHFGEVTLIIELSMDLKHTPKHLLRIIAFKGKNLCRLAAEDQFGGQIKRNNPGDSVNSKFEDPKSSLNTEASLVEKVGIPDKR